MLLTEALFFYITFLIYLLIRTYQEFSPFAKFRKGQSYSAYDAEKSYDRLTWFRKCGPFILIWLPLFLTTILPSIRIVSFDADTLAPSYDGQRYYVPFYYNGNFYAPGTDYLINDTHLDLALYPVNYKDGLFERAVSPHEMVMIEPYSVTEFEDYIYYEFSFPKESQFYYGDKKYYTRWALDTRDHAEDGLNYVEHCINNRGRIPFYELPVTKTYR